MPGPLSRAEEALETISHHLKAAGLNDDVVRAIAGVEVIDESGVLHESGFNVIVTATLSDLPPVVEMPALLADLGPDAIWQTEDEPTISLVAADAWTRDTGGDVL